MSERCSGERACDCRPRYATWATHPRQPRQPVYYFGQVRTACRAEQVWRCGHGHRTRGEAVACAEGSGEL